MAATHTRRSPGSWKSVGMPLSWDRGIPQGGAEAAVHSSRWHTPVAHRVPSHNGYRREQAAPVFKPTGGPPVWRHLVLPVRAHVLNTAYLHPPTHPVCANYRYVFSFHNTPDPLALRNAPIKLCITIARNNFTAIIHTSTPTSTKKLHSRTAKVGRDISHQMHLYTKILRLYAHDPSRVWSFKG